MHISATLYSVVQKMWIFFFLCKCLKLLYLIKELILWDLKMQSWYLDIFIMKDG